jgi:hypothetical protein
VATLSRACWFVLALLGCSSTSPNDAAGGNSNTGGRSSTGGSGGLATCEPGPGYAEPATPQRVDQVTATLLDQDGEPLGAELVQVCGTDLCFNGTSTAGGIAVVSPRQSITKPAFKFGEGKQSPRFAWLLPDELKVELGTIHSVRFPPPESGAELIAGTEASSGGLSLIPAAGGQIKFDKLTFEDPVEWRLRALPVPLDTAPGAVELSLGLELIYAATPTDTRFCPPAQLIIDNSESWLPNTEVEVFLHGVDVEQEWAPYGGWAKVSEARVSDDGEHIETTSPGLPVLGVLGFRRK